jgi:anti-sigma-K factor RskA
MSTEGDSGREGDRVLVAEFVLGLLEPAEHGRVARRIAADPALRREKRLWEAHLQHLDREFPETAPPPELFARVERRLFPEEPTAGWRAWLWNNLLVWRGITVAAVLVAAVAVSTGLLRPPPASSELANELVASLEASGSEVKFIAFYDGTSGTLRLVGLAGQAVPHKDYELWYIQPRQAPVSMGVVRVDQRLAITLGPRQRQVIGNGTVFAVTLEPEGGSPSGKPTGPVVAKGTATPI